MSNGLCCVSYTHFLITLIGRCLICTYQIRTLNQGYRGTYAWPGFAPRAALTHRPRCYAAVSFFHTSCTMSEEFIKWALGKVSLSLAKHFLKPNKEVGLLLEMLIMFVLFYNLRSNKKCVSHVPLWWYLPGRAGISLPSPCPPQQVCHRAWTGRSHREIGGKWLSQHRAPLSHHLTLPSSAATTLSRGRMNTVLLSVRRESNVWKRTGERKGGVCVFKTQPYKSFTFAPT